MLTELLVHDTLVSSRLGLGGGARTNGAINRAARLYWLSENAVAMLTPGELLSYGVYHQIYQQIVQEYMYHI